MSFWSLPVVKCSVVPYCIECTHWGSQKSNRIGRMLLDKSVDSKYLLCKTRSPWTRSILLMKERWMPKQIAIIYLRGFVCADSTNFFGASLLNCSFRTESRVTHALVRCVLILMASLSLWWNLLHSIHSFILFDIYLEQYCCDPFTENLCECGYNPKTIFLWSRVLLARVLLLLITWRLSFGFGLIILRSTVEPPVFRASNKFHSLPRRRS